MTLSALMHHQRMDGPPDTLDTWSGPSETKSLPVAVAHGSSCFPHTYYLSSCVCLSGAQQNRA